MRIALLISEPSISGEVTYLSHLADGLRAHGHDVTILASTRSGRSSSYGRTSADTPSGRSTRVPATVIPLAELARTLDTYDLTIVNKLDHPTPQPITAALAQTRTRWTFIAHGNSYARATWLPSFLSSSRTFRPPVLAHPGNDPPARFIRVAERPYTFHSPFSLVPLAEREVDVGFAGRAAWDKGYAAIAALGFIQPGHLTVALHGAPVGGFPVQKSMYIVTRGLKSVAGAVNEHTWLRTSFHTGFHDPYAVKERFRIEANATRRGFSDGLEYATLEALDAGCLVAVSDALHVPDLPGIIRYPYTYLSSHEAARHPHHVRDMYAALTLALVTRTEDDVAETVAALRNRHSPTRVAEIFLAHFTG